MRTLAFLSVVCALAAGCGGAATSEPSAPAPASATAPQIASACTLETPLVPGVPGSPGHLIPSDINPNGASELASLMRTMQADLKGARAAILAGTYGAHVAPASARYQKMRCAWPTTPSDRNATFDAYAQGYLAAVERLEKAAPAEAAAAYEATLDACRACHDQSCPGPLMAIKGLRLRPEE